MAPKPSTALELTTVERLSQVDAAAWDRLHDGRNPFIRHAFLAGLEQHDCLEPQGWYANHLIARIDGELVGALPLYLRTNSYGEFVFDWAWADAFERSGGKYYPKLVSAIPFTPATGPRLLVAADHPLAADIARALQNGVHSLVDGEQASSWHCLFPDSTEGARLEALGNMLRIGCQYHWFNRNYADFDDFLASLSSKRRKQIKRERRDVAAADVTIEALSGEAITPAHWRAFYPFYCGTFYRKWGEPRLTEGFFNYLSESPDLRPLLLLARSGSDYVAGAFAMEGTDTLFGRHWGCSRHLRHLHFELCYYRTIDYCIEHGLDRLDAGAQGEHKMFRGFEPVKTFSAHYIAHPGFRAAVADFLRREASGMESYIDDIGGHSAYRRGDGGVPAIPAPRDGQDDEPG